MKFEQRDYSFKVEFSEEPFGWSLLVVDDVWGRVRNLICGPLDKNEGGQGLLEKCIDKTIVGEHWASFAASTETFDRVLANLPWMISDMRFIRSIVYADFPHSVEEAKELLSFAGKNEMGGARRIAALIDQNDVRIRAGSTIVIEKVWRLFDEANHPAYCRARFSRGGLDLPPWVCRLPYIAKDSSGGVERQAEIIGLWLETLQGKISGECFQRQTRDGDCHTPSSLKRASYTERRRVCLALSGEPYDHTLDTSMDAYGVWKWASRLAALEDVKKNAAHRWLAAKAFQTTDPGAAKVPVTALVGICEGARFLLSSKELNYDVRSGLYDLSEDPSVIDALPALGRMVLEEGKNYEDLARALRDWILCPEQFDEGNAKVSEIEIRSDEESLRVSVRFIYDGILPKSIFTDPERIGRTTRAWRSLLEFTEDSSHAGNSVETIFKLFIPGRS